jgi:hypothetical protein
MRRAFATLSGDAKPTVDCPESERLWSAARGELPPRELESVGLHIVGCAACGEAWRFAVEMLREAGESVGAERAQVVGTARPTARWMNWSLAAAATVLLAFVGVQVWNSSFRPRDSDFRSVEEPRGVRSLVPEDSRISRTDFVLRWTPGPEASLYTVRLTTEEYEPVVTAEGLTQAELAVSPEELEPFAPGTRLLWQVEVFSPDGERIVSDTFFVEVD